MAQLKRVAAVAACLAALLVSSLSRTHAADEPRTILGLYGDVTGFHIENYRLFHTAEMPLNHLGLALESHNVVHDVPTLAGRADVRGVLVWLQQNRLPNPDAVIVLIADAVKRGIPVIIFEQVPGAFNADGSEAPPERAGRALALIGVRDLGGYRPYTFDMKVAAIDRSIAGFERRFEGPLPPVDVFAPTGAAQAALTLERSDGTRTSPILITPQGAYVAPDYVLWGEPNGDRTQWWVNPFVLFARVYHTDAMPKADPTTLSGRRIYFSQIDGDGWLNVSNTEGYREHQAYSSEVVQREVIEAYPDLPVTVAPIAADLDPKFAGTPRAQSVARALFALPQVEPGSHTYTHPYQWSYFAPGNYNPKDELRFRKYYARSLVEPGYDAGTSSGEGSKLEEGYVAPRAYGDIPFDLYKEIEGAAAFISSFAPKGKPVRVIQWSGDTGPFGEAVAEAYRASLANINGGDTRFDAGFPSYTSVAPFGRLIGGQRQIYAASANENLYTDNWTRRYAAFRQTLQTIANTGTPLRVTAGDVYYHMYSGEREASLRALKDVLDAVSKMELAPVATSHYSEIARGFYTARFEQAGPLAWRVHDRGALATVRFDAAGALTVDYARSQGVLGHRRAGGELYVALDGADDVPLIALKKGADAPAPCLVLQDSRWEIRALQQTEGQAAFIARGYGPGEMRWRAHAGERWHIEADYGGRIERADVVTDAGGLLVFALPRGGENGVRVRMTRMAAGRAS